MRHAVVALFSVTVVIGACTGGGTATQAPGGQTTAPGQATAAGGQPTPAAQPTPADQPAPAPGASTVTVVLTGGDDAGTYTGTDNPNCALGFMGEGVWSVAYSIFEGSTAGQLSNLVVVYSPAGSKVDVGIGPLFDTAAGYNVYMIDTENGIGSGSVEVNDTGSTAVLHATGTTDDGVGIDATVNCPSVTR